MPLQDVSTLARISLSKVIAKQKRQPFSLANSLSVTEEIIAKVYALHKEGRAFPLVMKNIIFSYDQTSHQYHSIDIYHQHGTATEPHNIENDKYQITPVLETLLEMTDITPHGKMGQIIDYIIGNELQAFRLGCDHFLGKNITESLEMLSKVFAIMTALIKAPAPVALENLDIAQSRNSGLLPKILGEFIQNLSQDEGCNEKLIGFLIDHNKTQNTLSEVISFSEECSIELFQDATPEKDLFADKEALTDTKIETTSTAATTPIPATPPITNTEENLNSTLVNVRPSRSSLNMRNALFYASKIIDESGKMSTKLRETVAAASANR